MVNIQTLLTLQGQIFLLALLGVIFRRKFVGAEFQKGLSTVLLDLILPCNIITSFQTEISSETLARTGYVLAISVSVQVLAFVLAAVLFRKADPERSCVMKYATCCPNSAFLGIPITEGIWGAEGVLLATIFLLPQRIAMWTVGISYYTGSMGEKAWKKLATNHCIIAMAIGVLLMVTGWQLPAPVQNAVNSLSRCTTGVSMFLVGMILAQLRLSDFLDGQILWISVIRMAVLPAIVFLGCRLLGLEKTAVGVSVLLTAMPAGTLTALIASRYNKAVSFAGSVVTVSTLLSLVAIPIWGMILS